MSKTFSYDNKVHRVSGNHVYESNSGKYKGYIRNGIFYSENGGTMIDLRGYGVQTLGGTTVGQKYGWGKWDEDKKSSKTENSGKEIDMAAEMVVDVVKGVAIVTVGTAVIAYEVGKGAYNIVDKLGEKLSNAVNSGLQKGVDGLIALCDAKIAEHETLIHLLLQKGLNVLEVNKMLKDDLYCYRDLGDAVTNGKTGEKTGWKIVKKGNVRYIIDKNFKQLYTVDESGTIRDKETNKVVGKQRIEQGLNKDKKSDYSINNFTI